MVGNVRNKTYRVTKLRLKEILKVATAMKILLPNFFNCNQRCHSKPVWSLPFRSFYGSHGPYIDVALVLHPDEPLSGPRLESRTDDFDAPP